MRIAFNPSTVAALITPPNNKDITFDLRGQNIFARGVKFCGTDTNTWRDIKINNVSIDSNTLDLRDGDNTTLTNINGVVTINSTWRPVVDNLTSDSTTSSLSANQGRVLAELIDGKSDSDHNHDDRYLRLTGGWMSGDINFGGDNKIYWGRNSDSASISFKNDGDGDADSYMSFVTSDNGNEYFRWSHSSGSTNTEWMALRSDGLRVGGTKVSLEGHSHNDLYYTKAEVNNKLNGKSDTSHTHDDRYLKLTGGIINGVVGINATGVCGNSVLTVGPQDKRINTGIVDRYGTMLQIVGTGKKNEGGVIGFHNPGLYSAIIGFVRDTNETGFIFDTDVDRNSWYVKARAFKGNLIGNADKVDNYHIADESRQVYRNYYTVDSPAGAWILIKLPAWNANNEIVAIDGYGDNRQAHCVVHCGSRYQGIWGYQSNYNCLVVSKIRWKEVDSGKFAIVALIDGGITNLSIKSTSSLEISKTTEDNAAFAISSSFFSSGGVFHGNVDWDKIIGKPSSFTPSAHTHSWTSITDKIVAGNEFNIVNAGFNSDMYFNYLPINDRNSTAYINSYIFGNGHQGLALVQASGFVKNGSSDSYVLLGGGGHKAISDFASSSHSHNYAANENYGGFTKSGRLPISGFYQSCESGSGGNAPWSSWMHLINCQHSNTNNNYALQIAASFYDNNTFRIRVTNDDVNNDWRDIIHSGNIGSQSVNYANSAGYADTATNAYHLRINSANTWSTWYWAGQSGQPSWLWGSNDGTNMYVWDPNNFNVNTAQYLRSLGNQNCQTGRTQNYGDVYTYNTYGDNTGSPTSYTSVIGFGRGTAGTVEIAGGWCNTNLYWRSLRDYCDDWYSWRAVLDSSNYTEFINNYYWADVKISTSANTQTQPSVNTIYANNWFRSQGYSGWYNESFGGGIWMNDSNWIRTYGGKPFYCDNQIYSSNSIKMSDILLEHTNEINSASGLHLNYRTSNNVTLCIGGGNVGISHSSPSYKLDVNGQMRASGFHHSSMDSNNYILLAGGGYKPYGGNYDNPIFLGYLNLERGYDGTISSSFYCLGYSVSFTYTRGGNYCKIYIPDTSYQVFYIRAAIASVNYSGGGMDTWPGYHRGDGAWWLHCYAYSSNEVRVKGFRQANDSNDSWWGGNPLVPDNGGANRITVCIFGYVTFR